MAAAKVDESFVIFGGLEVDMKFIELRSENGEECFCVNVDAIAYTKVNRNRAGDVEIFLRGGFNINAYVVEGTWIFYVRLWD
jgi:hypothetical protein